MENNKKVTVYMQKHLKSLLLLLAILLVQQTAQAQKDDENIGTEVINVVKPYTPSVSDAFKIKESPVIDDDKELEKKKVDYEINSIPVASTFTPSKGKAAVVEKQAPKKLYNNYASLAVGNYLNVLGEFYATLPISRTESFTLGLNHHSTQGEIEGVQLDDKFYDTGLSLMYGKRDRDVAYQIEGEFKHQLYNWYGTSYPLTDAQRASIDAAHTYMTGGLGAHLDVEDSFFKGGDIQYRRFWDDYDASENHILLQPEFEFEVSDKTINAIATLDYVGGVFDYNNADAKYNYLKAGVHPSFQILKDDLTLNLGAELVFGLDSENSDSDFYVYPKITASYRLVDEKVIAFGGIEGGLHQNSYYKFAQENKFIAPLQAITPTDNQYDAYLGLKGKLSSKVSYKVRASYFAEQNKALFMMNPVNDVDVATDNFRRANSFGVVYDDVNTFKFFGQLSAQVSKNYSVGVSGSYASYNSDNQAEAWNLPQLEANLFGDFKFSEKWFGGLNFFYVGERKDFLQSNVGTVPSGEVTLKGFFDANAHVGYNISDRFTAFLRANNIASQDYQRWSSYPVQQVQVLGGLTYKFDF